MEGKSDIAVTEPRRYTTTGNGYYALDGRKLDGKPKKKGVYVTEGKKVVVK